MLRKTILIGSVAFASALLTACESQKKESHSTLSDSSINENDPASREWKAMDEFHTVMAEAFHPYKDSSDLKPAKELAEELHLAAKNWRASELPENVDKKVMKDKLDNLADLAAKFEEQVKTASDQAIGTSLNEMHDLFHEIQNDWYGAAGSHDHDHDHH